VRDIATEFEILADALQNVLDVELTTAHELTDAEADGIVQTIAKASGREVNATRAVDPDLIGGIVLQAGSMRLDASVRGRLERLRQQLATTRS
jgi:F-type H+-transporting ATPase subunit delta